MGKVDSKDSPAIDSPEIKSDNLEHSQNDGPENITCPQQSAELEDDDDGFGDFVENKQVQAKES